jgi:nucleotide-binding universal stress UspA family protein
MRVLLAIDGSPGASVATDLVVSLDWPAASIVRVVTVLTDQGGMFGAGMMPSAPGDYQRLEDELLAALRGALEEAATRIERPGLTVEPAILRGRAASAIVDEAARFRADLVVLGSRGHGAFETTLLGSVSSEVADQAACPVLIARRGEARNLLLGDDGSAHSDGARRVVREWPILRDLPVRVASIGIAPLAWEAAAVPMASLEAEGFGSALAESRRLHTEIANRAHDELAVGGRPVDATVGIGSPARELVALAQEWKTDLVVVGSRGRTGLKRLLLGSVARSVLLHAPCSVLVVRQQAIVQPTEEGQPGDLVAI